MSGCEGDARGKGGPVGEEAPPALGAPVSPRATAAIAVLAAGTLGSCGGNPPLQVPITDLVHKPDVYVLDRITTSGTVVKEGAQSDSYALTDGEGNRLQLHPTSVIEGHAGRVVTVTGTFVRDLGSIPTVRVASVTAGQAG